MKPKQREVSVAVRQKRKIALLERQLSVCQDEIKSLQTDSYSYGVRVGSEYADKFRKQLAECQAENLRLRKALESLLSWVDDWAETSDTDFPRIEALCEEALYLSIPSGDPSALREVIAQVIEEHEGKERGYYDILRSGEWTPEALK